MPTTPETPRRIPWKQIAFAVFLFLLGSVGLILGMFIKFSHVPGVDKAAAIPLWILSSVVFLPGFYGVFLSYKAWNNVKGYSWDTLELIEFH